MIRHVALRKSTVILINYSNSQILAFLDSIFYGITATEDDYDFDILRNPIFTMGDIYHVGISTICPWN